MKKLILFVLMIVTLQADQEVHKVVFDLTAGDLKTFERKLLKGVTAHKTYYEANLQELEVAVVIHGGAYKFFVKEPKNSVFKEDKTLISSYRSLEKRLAFLVDTYEVNFYMCKVGMISNRLEQKDVFDFVSLVPNAAIGLIDKQNEGYAYIPIN